VAQRKSVKNISRIVLAAGIGGVLALTGCATVDPLVAKRVAQPDNRPVRNFTSFSASLRCLDDMLLARGMKRRAVTSSGFVDRTNRLSLGGDEMLINAVNQLNRKSRAYVFQDPPLERKDGQNTLLTTRGSKKERQAGLYFRGAISQLDSSVASDSGSLDVDTGAGSAVLEDTGFSRSRGVSVVSVDMHLVGYPSRTVIPGGSVANSMVVVTDKFGFGTEGVINLTGFDFSISISRVESLGQAVRNLIELGTLELLGRHAGVPYWECLNTGLADQKRDNKSHASFKVNGIGAHLPEVDRMLAKLGHLDSAAQVTDRDRKIAVSRFQAQERLIADGVVNFDLLRRLRLLTRAPVLQSAKPTQNAKKTPQSRDAQSNTALAITRTGPEPKAGASVQFRVATSVAGDLICYHGTNGNDLRQILPVEPGTRLRLLAGETVEFPRPNSRFDIVAEPAPNEENIMCILDPAGLNSLPSRRLAPKNALDVIKAQSFAEIRRLYLRKNAKSKTATLSIRVGGVKRNA
jgi:hypothetical protein